MNTNEILNIFKSFVEGELTPSELEDFLEINISKLDIFDGLNIKPYTNDYPINVFLASTNYSCLGSQLNLQDLFSKILNNFGVSYNATPIYTNQYNLMLEICPRWLLITDSYFVKLISEFPSLPAKDLNNYAMRIK